MGFFNLCGDDPIVTTLKEVFKANIVRIPEERIQPLTVVASSDGHDSFVGSLSELIAGEPRLKFRKTDFSVSRMADVSSMRSRKVNLEVGLEVLGGFLKGFGIPPAGISTEIQKASKVAFSFQNVQRKYVDIGWLGNLLTGRYINRHNPVTSIFFDEWYDFHVISSTITSSDFTISAETENKTKIKLDVPLIQNIVSQANAGMEVSSVTGLDLTFKGDKSLTFAFTCVILYINPDGKIEVTAPDSNFHTLQKNLVEKEITYNPDTVLLHKEPGMLSFDN